MTPVTWWKLTDASEDDFSECVRGEPHSLDPGALSAEEGKVWDLLIFGPEISEPDAVDEVSFEEDPSEMGR